MMTSGYAKTNLDEQERIIKSPEAGNPAKFLERVA